MARRPNAPRAADPAPEVTPEARLLTLAPALFEPGDDDALLRRTVVMAGAPGGLGFQRAFLWVAGPDGRALTGRHAVGPEDADEAGRQPAALDEADVSSLARVSDAELEDAAPGLTGRLRSVHIALGKDGSDPVGAVFAEGGSAVLDAAADGMPAWCGRLELHRFALATVTAFGRPVALVIADRPFSDTPPGEAEAARLAKLCGLASRALERSRLEAGQSEHSAVIAALEEAARCTTSTLGLRNGLSFLNRLAAQTLGCQGAALWRLPSDRPDPALVLESVHVADERIDPLRAAEGFEALARQVARGRTPRHAVEATAIAGLDPALVRDSGAVYATPVAGGNGPLGVLVLWGPAPHALTRRADFTIDDRRFAESVAALVAGLLAQNGLSERVRTVEGRLLDARKQLATNERLSALGEMAARAAGEARHPLSAISGFARRLDRTLAPEDPNREVVEIILREADRLERLLEEQLSFVRVSRPALGLMQPNTLLAQALSEVNDRMVGKRVRLLKRFAPDVPELLLDGEKIRLVVGNMLQHAVDHAPSEGRVRVETRRAQGYVVVEIASDGPPPAGELLDQLFVPFARARAGGDGLGLAVAQQVVQSHGGEIRVRSEGDWGLVFSFTLPVLENRDRRRPAERRGTRSDRRNRFPAA